MSGKKELNDFTSKYFDNYYFTPHLTEKDLLNLVNPIIENIIKIVGLSDQSYNTLVNEFNDNSADIIKSLKQELKSIRLVKSFNKNLERNLKIIKNDIYFPDIILISLVKTNKLRLFDFIRKNYIDLSISPAVKELAPFFGIYTFFPNLKNMYISLLEQASLSEVEKDILFALFPHVEFTLNYKHENAGKYEAYIYKITELYNDIEKRKRFAHYLLINRFFASETIEKSIERITSQNLKEELISYFSSINFSVKPAVSKLYQLFPLGDENINIRRISINWVHQIINSKESKEILARNILIAYSFITKNLSQKSGFFTLSEKKSAAYIVWDYLKRDDSKKAILLKLLSYTDNSDTFADTILFYSITPDRIIVKLPLNLVKRIVIGYILRIENKLTNSSSIFDSRMFDDVVVTIYRWEQALSFLDKEGLTIKLKYNIKNHLYDNLIDNPYNFETMFEYSFEDLGNDKLYFKPESYEPILGQDNLINIVSSYIRSSKKFNFSKLKIESIKNWLMIILSTK